MEKGIEEFRERELRKCNLIFHNLPESTNPDPMLRKEDDIKLVQSVVCDTLGCQPLVVNEAIRIGKPQESKKRLLKVMVPSVKVKREVLTKAPTLNRLKDSH